MRKFGLIGYPLGHSFSRKYFMEKFSREHIVDSVYSNYEIDSITTLPDILKDSALQGLNVTIPYKESVIPFLHKKDPVVSDIAACNCIKISKGVTTGFNTDVIGFEKSLTEKLTFRDQRALILGTGGSSKAVAWVLRQKGIQFLFVSRKKNISANQISYEELNEDLITSHPLIVNCSPLGMSPNPGSCPEIPYAFISQKHYLFDLVYNPDKTLFLKKGEEAGARVKNGADMLAIQAEASWSIWNE